MKRLFSWLSACLLAFGFCLSCFSETANALGSFTLGTGKNELLVSGQSFRWFTASPMLFDRNDNTYKSEVTETMGSAWYTGVACRATNWSISGIFVEHAGGVYATAGVEYILSYGLLLNDGIVGSDFTAPPWMFEQPDVTFERLGYKKVDGSYSAQFKFVSTVDQVVTLRVAMNMRVTNPNSVTASLKLTQFEVSGPDAADSVAKAIEDQYDDSAKDQFSPGVGGIGENVGGNLGGVGDESLNDRVGGIFGSTPGPATIKFPSFSMTIEGESHKVWDEYIFNFQVIDDVVPALMVAVRLATSIVCYILMVRYMEKVYKEIFERG